MAQSLRKASELTMGDEMKVSGPPGFIQTCRTSKPPLSVASISFSQMEDSESLVRAYKKKKTELQTIQEQFYQVETQMIMATQQNVILNEENSALKARVADLERMLKESQMRELRKESSQTLTKQLEIKTKEVEMYQKET